MQLTIGAYELQLQMTRSHRERTKKNLADDDSLIIKNIESSLRVWTKFGRPTNYS